MRYTHLFALAAVAGTAATTASAQSRVSVETRSRAATAPTANRVWNIDEPAHRAALGVSTEYTGTLRDTLGLLVSSITKGSPAEKAGLEEGNRIAAINTVSLRINAADIDDGEMTSAIQRRLSRELGKSKPGDEIELKVYSDGRSRTVKIKTADSDELFARTEMRSTSVDRENRPALGFSLGSTGSRRDTLGVLVMGVSDSAPASKAGLEEGNRIAAINGVNLRVAREDAGDRSMGSIKAQRLQREVSQLKVGDNVTLKVYSNGQFRDVTMKVARAGDLPRSSNGMMYITGDGGFGAITMPRIAPMPAMPSMPAMPRAPMGATLRYQIEDDVRNSLDGVRLQLDDIRPQLDRIGPEMRREFDRIRPEIERARVQARDAVERVRMTMPRVRIMRTTTV
jgi:S1-C subfamily serine protease